jgi:hypothetical protein
MNKPIEGHAQFLIVRLDRCFRTGPHIPQYPEPDLTPRQGSQARAPLKAQLRKGHDASSLLRIGGAKTSNPEQVRLGLALPVRLQSSNSKQGNRTRLSYLKPTSAKSTTGAVYKLCSIEILFSHRITWELTVLLGLIWQL